MENLTLPQAIVIAALILSWAYLIINMFFKNNCEHDEKEKTP